MKGWRTCWCMPRSRTEYSEKGLGSAFRHKGKTAPAAADDDIVVCPHLAIRTGTSARSVAVRPR